MNDASQNRIKELSVIILAGGESKRMMYPKPWLKFQNEASFLTSLISIFNNFGIKEIVVVINKKFVTTKWKNEVIKVKDKALIVENSTPEKGRLYSLQLALKAVKNEVIFIHNVDNPFIKENILQQLTAKINYNGVTIPSFNNKGGHPVIITKKVKKEILTNYTNYNTLKEVFLNFTKKYVEMNNDSILKNINTPEELEKAKNEFV